MATRPSTFLRVRLATAPPPGEYTGRLRSHVGWRLCSISVLADDATLVCCRPRPAAPLDVVGEEVEVEFTHAWR